MFAILVPDPAGNEPVIDTNSVRALLAEAQCESLPRAAADGRTTATSPEEGSEFRAALVRQAQIC